MQIHSFLLRRLILEQRLNTIKKLHRYRHQIRSVQFPIRFALQPIKQWLKSLSVIRASILACCFGMSTVYASNISTTITESSSELAHLLPKGNHSIYTSTISNSQKLNQQEAPSLYHVMMAEFSAERDNMPEALSIYKQEAFNKNSSAVFERALSLSMAHESVEESLAFASAWQQQYPEHTPALFFVTYLALKSHNYELVGEKLHQILQYDPNVDLSNLLTGVGIYPERRQDQADLLNVLQNLDTKNNISLSVLKAGLLLQFNQPKQALIHIDKALKKQPHSPAFIILKADILQKLETPEKVTQYIDNARKNSPRNENLFLYQIRYLIRQGKSIEAWQLLTETNPEFLANDEVKLLAALIGVDVQSYKQADSLFLDLTNSPNYRDQAYYYLAISAERQLNIPQAIIYYGKVMQPNLVLESRKKQIALLEEQYRFDEAIASMEKLRNDFDDFVPQSYILQARILSKSKQIEKAIALLDEAQKILPENTDILSAKAVLLPDDDENKRLLFQQVLQIAPNNVKYQLQYAQVLVTQQQDNKTVTRLLEPLLNDREEGLRARQILAQQALHNQDYEKIIFLLSDNFDISPDIQSGILLKEAYSSIGNTVESSRIADILTNDLKYTE